MNKKGKRTQTSKQWQRHQQKSCKVVVRWEALRTDVRLSRLAQFFLCLCVVWHERKQLKNNFFPSTFAVVEHPSYSLIYGIRPTRNINFCAIIPFRRSQIYNVHWSWIIWRMSFWWNFCYSLPSFHFADEVREADQKKTSLFLTLWHLFSSGMSTQMTPDAWNSRRRNSCFGRQEKKRFNEMCVARCLSPFFPAFITMSHKGVPWNIACKCVGSYFFSLYTPASSLSLSLSLSPSIQRDSSGNGKQINSNFS